MCVCVYTHIPTWRERYRERERGREIRKGLYVRSHAAVRIFPDLPIQLYGATRELKVSEGPYSARSLLQ